MQKIRVFLRKGAVLSLIIGVVVLIILIMLGWKIVSISIETGPLSIELAQPGIKNAATNRVDVTPEDFIRNYYSAINQREYQTTFNWLSSRFKDAYHCCEQDGNYKYDEYVHWWNTVDAVDVQKVELQEQSTGRATVVASLRFHYKDGRSVDDEHIFQLVSDGNAGWLIDD